MELKNMEENQFLNKKNDDVLVQNDKDGDLIPDKIDSTFNQLTHNSEEKKIDILNEINNNEPTVTISFNQKEKTLPFITANTLFDNPNLANAEFTVNFESNNEIINYKVFDDKEERNGTLLNYIRKHGLYNEMYKELLDATDKRYDEINEYLNFLNNQIIPVLEEYEKSELKKQFNEISAKSDTLQKGEPTVTLMDSKNSITIPFSQANELFADKRLANIDFVINYEIDGKQSQHTIKGHPVRKKQSSLIEYFKNESVHYNKEADFYEEFDMLPAYQSSISKAEYLNTKLIPLLEKYSEVSNHNKNNDSFKTLINEKEMDYLKNADFSFSKCKRKSEDGRIIIKVQKEDKPLFDKLIQDCKKISSKETMRR